MVKKEIQIFFIELKVKDVYSNKKLSKNFSIEVEWIEGNVGRLVDDEVKILDFQDEKDRNYKIALGNLSLRKGWFGDKVTYYEVEPFPAESFIILKNEEGKLLKIRNYQ